MHKAERDRMDIKTKRRCAWTLYGFGSVIFIIYFLMEMDGQVRIDPFERIFFLLIGCGCLYFAGRLLGSTVSEQASVMVMRSTFRAFFLVYLLLILTFTLFDDAFGRGNGAFMLWGLPSAEEAKTMVNLTPFRTIRLYFFNIQNDRISWRDFFINIFGNLFAFMPMAFFLPLLFKRFQKRLNFFLVVTLSVMTIEFLQLLSRRGSCDVDDLILNVFGALVAFEIFHCRPVRRLTAKLTLQ